jgi:hypothetical protein
VKDVRDLVDYEVSERVLLVEVLKRYEASRFLAQADETGRFFAQKIDA